LNIRWIVDADVSGFFDNLDHDMLREIIKQRINDGGIIRLIGKWLNAGVLEEGLITYPDKGTPQGGVISPLISNIYLHHVLDDWFVKEVKPRMRGRCFLIRYADDFIIGCEFEGDARRILEVLRKRFGRYGLNLHPEKTALIKFRKPGEKETKSGTGNGTFDFLGFTHYWAKSRRGYWVIKRKTTRKGMRRIMRDIWLWCKENLHWDIREQYDMLCSKLRGLYNYYGIRSNFKSLEVMYEHTERAWRRWLSRRCHKGEITWKTFELMREIMPLPKPRLYHKF
jgi:group II intron reverse transcriptase/maturase